MRNSRDELVLDCVQIGPQRELSLLLFCVLAAALEGFREQLNVALLLSAFLQRASA